MGRSLTIVVPIVVGMMASEALGTVPGEYVWLESQCLINDRVECLLVELEVVENPPTLPKLPTTDLKFRPPSLRPDPPVLDEGEYIFEKACSPSTGHYLAVVKR